MFSHTLRLLALVSFVCLGLLGQTHAADTAPAAEAEAATLRAALVRGPQDVKLASQGVLHLPAGYLYLPQPQAAQWLRAQGNPGDYSDIFGLVFPAGEAEWFAVLRFEASGYIKDDDAREWKVDEMLRGFREGTEASNAERKKMGVPELEIVGWAQSPKYDAGSHRLVWAMSSKHKGDTADAHQGVNFNTYALGREGYLSLNLVTGLNDLPAHKPAAEQLLGALDFAEGKKYTDFNASTDHVAEYGLAALVLGAGAKKLGLLAGLGLFFAKFAKVILLAGAGLVAVVGKFLGRKSDTA